MISKKSFLLFEFSPLQTCERKRKIIRREIGLVDTGVNSKDCWRDRNYHELMYQQFKATFDCGFQLWHRRGNYWFDIKIAKLFQARFIPIAHLLSRRRPPKMIDQSCLLFFLYLIEPERLQISVSLAFPHPQTICTSCRQPILRS